jgi:hypothetical protein
MVLLSVPELVNRTSSMPDGEKRLVTYGRSAEVAKEDFA